MSKALTKNVKLVWQTRDLSSCFISRFESFEEIDAILGGYIGLVEAGKNYLVTPAGADFVDQMRAAPSTISLSPTGHFVCSNQTDSFGIPL